MATTALQLVEDDEFVRLALTRALNRTGVFAVTPAQHGQHALGSWSVGSNHLWP